MFRICFIDPYQGYALADFAFRKMNARKVGFLTAVSSPYPFGLQPSFFLPVSRSSCTRVSIFTC